MITKAQALSANYRQHFFFLSRLNGEVKRCRVSGKCQTWKTRPDEFRLPIKYDLYQSHYIGHDNAHEFFANEHDAENFKQEPQP